MKVRLRLNDAKGKKPKVRAKKTTLSAAQKAYSLHKKKNGPVAEIENAPYGSKGDAAISWWDKEQSKKSLSAGDKKLNKSADRQAKYSDKQSKERVDKLSNDFYSSMHGNDAKVERGFMKKSIDKHIKTKNVPVTKLKKEAKTAYRQAKGFLYSDLHDSPSDKEFFNALKKRGFFKDMIN